MTPEERVIFDKINHERQRNSWPEYSGPEPYETFKMWYQRVLTFTNTPAKRGLLLVFRPDIEALPDLPALIPNERVARHILIAELEALGFPPFAGTGLTFEEWYCVASETAERYSYADHGTETYIVGHGMLAALEKYSATRTGTTPTPPTPAPADVALNRFLGCDQDGVYRMPGQNEDGTIGPNGKFL